MVDDGKMSNAIRSTATLGMLITGLLFGWQVSAAIIIAIAGYRNTELNLDIIDKKNKNSININRNLHDLCSKYLHDKGE